MVGRILGSLSLLVVLFSCSSSNSSNIDSLSTEEDSLNRISSDRQIIVGNTQGTSYRIVIASNETKATKEAIDSVLRTFDYTLSTYIDSSEISTINKSGRGVIKVDDSHRYLAECLALSRKVNQLTKGAFDPTVKPLIDAWGIYESEQRWLDSSEVDSIKVFVGFKDNFEFSIGIDSSGNFLPLKRIKKKDARAKLDVNAVAQGQAVDVLFRYLKELGETDFLVEIGGELRSSGKNSRGKDWSIGVEKPLKGQNYSDLQGVVELKNRGIATSGNYRKVFQIKGHKIHHSINPKTGYPEERSLISVTVLAPTAAEADAYATAFMVMGHDRARKFVMEHPELKLAAYFILVNPNGTYSYSTTPGFVIKDPS